LLSSTTPPEGDGLENLFGDSRFDWNVTPPSSAAPQFASRRELRESTASAGRASRAGKATRQAKPAKATKPGKPAKAVKSTASSKSRRVVAPVPRADSAYPQNRVLVVVRSAPTVKKKRGHNILTAFVVVGLFGSVALPAAALSPQVTTDPGVAASVDDAASLTVSKDAAASAGERGEFSATTATDLRSQRNTARKAANFEAYLKSGARELGDDYPWFSELSANQGGYLSPLNYFYRECVDFVAWRLNRDAGSTTAPFLYDWSTLTPGGGNASQWKYAWRSHGWTMSETPIAGSVASFTGNHVAYVKQVNPDGTVLLEEYNFASDHLYGQRTIPASEVDIFLYPPPR
jgi:surface antigen